MKTIPVLVIIFNHNHEANIEKLERIYSERFSRIFFLIPFYTGKRNNVIPVFGSSHYFHGFIAQGLFNFKKDDASHYIFIADDLILNPNINELNYRDYFQINNEQSFIPEYFNLADSQENRILYMNTVKEKYNPSIKSENKEKFWDHTRKAIEYSPEKVGFQVGNNIPSYQEATLRLKHHGIDICPLEFEDVFGVFPRIQEKGSRYCLNYPQVAGYSDIFIISSDTIQDFGLLCGFFFTTELYVELAIPTAALLATELIITEKEIKNNGRVYWPYSHTKIIQYSNEVKIHEGSIENILKCFNEDLYIHPIKLSCWT